MICPISVFRAFLKLKKDLFNKNKIMTNSELIRKIQEPFLQENRPEIRT
jgi:ribosome biogenesis protein Tsr3